MNIPSPSTSLAFDETERIDRSFNKYGVFTAPGRKCDGGCIADWNEGVNAWGGCWCCQCGRVGFEKLKDGWPVAL